MNMKERSVKNLAVKLTKIVPDKLYGDYELLQALSNAIERIVDEEMGEMNEQLRYELVMMILDRIRFEVR